MLQLNDHVTVPAPGANTDEHTVFDSAALSSGTKNLEALVHRGGLSIDHCIYRASIKHSHAGTLKAYGSQDHGVTWNQFFERFCGAPATAKRMREIAIPVAMHRDVKVTWTNAAATAQTTWYVGQALLTAAENDDAIEDLAAVVPGPFASLDNYAEASSTTHVVRPVRASWKGRRVRFRAKGANIWLVFGAADTVEADRAALVSNASSSGWTGNVKICDPLADGEWRDFYIDPSWTHFSHEADAASTLYAFASDYDATDLPA